MTRRGFTIIEMLAVILVIGVLAGLLLPAVQSSREMARRTSCANNLAQIGLAITAYHAAFRQLPVQMCGTDGSSVDGADNDRRLSFLVPLLPFVGHEVAYDSLQGSLPRTNLGIGSAMTMDQAYAMEMESMATADVALEDAEVEPGEAVATSQPAPVGPWPPGGPEPFQLLFEMWHFEVPNFRCPSDPGFGIPAFGRTNYAACVGDAMIAMDTGPVKDINGTFAMDPSRASQTDAAMRGVFVPRTVTRLDDITDGLSMTMMCGEIATGLGDRDVRTDPVVGPGENILRDEINWAYGLVDVDVAGHWLPSTKVMTDISQRTERGYRWADGAPLFTSFNAILPPNHPIALSNQLEHASGILPPSSRHVGGTHVCMTDGAIRFVTDSVDAGDRHAPTVYVGSPSVPGEQSTYGVWGAMATRASNELRSLPE